jgi:polo-like kinase 1
MKRELPRSPQVPDTLIRRRDGSSNLVYRKHEEIGRGGFASVYRFTDEATGESFALKAISRERVAKPKSLEKLKTEISIQRSLSHPNIVKSYDNFEDADNYYIILELCPGHSIRDRLKRSIRLSEAETKSILREIVAGVCYLHDNRVIHRDLKLENFLVGHDGRIKIADFGLSAQLDYDDERKYTVCGTPNYLSPELLMAATRGHSYEVDIWTIGVCAFAMLTGHPPFETRETKLTYEHIKHCRYRFPDHIRLSDAARDFVKCILQISPERRPSVQDLATHSFLAADPEPKFQLPERGLALVKPRAVPKPVPPPEHEEKQQVPKLAHPEREENQQVPKGFTCDVMVAPMSCVSRFCDHSDRYGLGYLLVDGTIGACFNDLTRMVMDPHERFVQYWENYQTVTPEFMDPLLGRQVKKLSLLRRFCESLKKTKSMFELPDRQYREEATLRHVKYWTRNDQATLFRMDDRNIQVNFNDRCKVVIFWNMKKMMMVKNVRNAGRPLPLSDVGMMGANVEERKRFAVAREMLAEMSGK